MRKISKLLAILISIVIMAGMTVVMSAEGPSVKAEIVDSKTEYSAGDTVEIIVSLADCEVANGMSIAVSFDESLLAISSGKWLPDYDIGNFNKTAKKGVFASVGGEYTNLNGDVFTLTLTVADDAPIADTVVTSTLVVSNDDGTLVEQTVEVEITIAGEECTHNWAEDDNKQYPADEATCVDDATYYKVCSVCGEPSDTEIFVDEGTVLGHNWIVDTEKKELATPATCEDDAKYYKVCSVCGEHSDTETFIDEGTARGHDWSDWTDVSDDDEKHYSECENDGCDETKSEDHSWNSVEVTTPESCYKDGTKTYTCSDCNGTKTEAIPATGNHVYVDWEYKEGDSEKHYGYCETDGCEESESESHDLGDYVDEENNEEQHYQECSACHGKIYSDHNWDEGTVTNEPTCIDGEREHTCSDCNGTKTESISAIGEHVWGDWITADDLTHRRDCDNCDEYETENHNVENGTSLGLTENHKHTGVCVVCNDVDAQEACTWDEGTVQTPASCCDDGKMLYTCTSGCTGTKTEKIPATGEHVWGDWVDNEDGTHTRTCENGTTETFDHNWDEGTVTTPATCYAEGEMLHECDDCDATKTEPIEKSIHVYDDPIPDDDGETHTAYCKNYDRCGMTVTQNHEFDNGVETTEPSCYETGLETFTCADCEYSYTEEIPATGNHVLGEWVDSADGKTHTRTCNTEGCPESETHNYSAVLAYNEAGHWYICENGCTRVYGYEAHDYDGDVCTECGYEKPANVVVSGYIYVNEDYHMMILTNGVIVSNHVLDVNDICIYCLGHVPSEEEGDTIVEIVDPVEPSTEEEETDVVPDTEEPEENPETGLAFGTLALAVASMAIALCKKH